MNNSGYIVEIAEGGPWLAQDLSVAVRFEDRGVWASEEEAQKAARDSLLLCSG